ncbi:unnamed protein product, partial [Ectocarpus sp. 12 AP-2014]
LRCLPTGKLAVEVIKTNLSRCKRRPPGAAAENAGSAGGAGVQPKATTTAITPPAPSAAAAGWRSVPTSAGLTRGERQVFGVATEAYLGLSAGRDTRGGHVPLQAPG